MSVTHTQILGLYQRLLCQSGQFQAFDFRQASKDLHAAALHVCNDIFCFQHFFVMGDVGNTHKSHGDSLIGQAVYILM